jgi:anti-anti-sigma factor
MPRSLPLLAVSLVPDRDRPRVAAAGELDLSTAHLLRRQLAELREAGWRDVAVDLREVRFMDSSGLHVLIDAGERARAAAGRLSIVVEPGPVERLIALTGSEGVLELA